MPSSPSLSLAATCAHSAGRGQRPLSALPQCAATRLPTGCLESCVLPRTCPQEPDLSSETPQVTDRYSCWERPEPVGWSGQGFAPRSAWHPHRRDLMLNAMPGPTRSSAGHGDTLSYLHLSCYLHHSEQLAPAQEGTCSCVLWGCRRGRAGAHSKCSCFIRHPESPTPHSSARISLYQDFPISLNPSSLIEEGFFILQSCRKQIA